MDSRCRPPSPPIAKLRSSTEMRTGKGPPYKTGSTSVLVRRAAREGNSVVMRIEIGRELVYNGSGRIGSGSPAIPAPLPAPARGVFSEVRLTRPLGHCDRSCCHTLRRPHPRFPSLPSPGVVENPTVGKCQDGGVLARWAGRPRVYPSARKVADPPRWGIGPCSPSVRLWSALSHCPGTQSPGSAGS